LDHIKARTSKRNKYYCPNKRSKLWSGIQYKADSLKHPKEIRKPIMSRLSRYKQTDITRGIYDNDLTFDWFLELEFGII